MFVPKMLARLALVGTAIVANATLGASDAYAVNVDCDFQLPGFPATMTAGTSYTIKVKLSNDSSSAYPAAHRVFVVSLNGLTPGAVTMSSGGTPLTKSATGPGQVTLTDPTSVAIGANGDPGDAQSWPYQIQFSAAAPAGNAQVRFIAYQGTSEINSAQRLTNMVNPGVGGRSPSPTVSAKPTTGPSAKASPSSTLGALAGSTPPASDAPTDSAAAGDGAATEGAGDSTVPLGAPASSKGGAGLIYIGAAVLIGAAATVVWRLTHRQPAYVHEDSHHPAGGFTSVQRPPRYVAPPIAPPASGDTDVIPVVRKPPRGIYTPGD